MKKLLVVMLALLLLVMVVPTFAQEESMCPGHEGHDIASLRTCVEHALTEGHISSAGVGKSLLAKVDAAQAAYDRGQPAVAIHILEAFVHQVSAQSGQHIVAAHAEHLIDHAHHVIEMLGG